METLITYLRQRIKECVKEANKTNPRVKEKLKKSIHDRINSNIVSTFYFILFKLNLFIDTNKIKGRVQT